MAPGTVLLVEDEEDLRIAVSKMLRKRGFTVLEAVDGRHALEVLRTHMDDLTVILLDVTLPGVASTDVLREVRMLRPDLQVILTSAYGEQKVAAMFAGLGSNRFLRKPYRQTEILKLLAPDR
jgi:two-component system cell cycle sensor histidine kinase/response regulator CckA